MGSVSQVPSGRLIQAGGFSGMTAIEPAARKGITNGMQAHNSMKMF